MKTTLSRHYHHNGRTNLTPADGGYPEFIRELLVEFQGELGHKSELLSLTLEMASSQLLAAVRAVVEQNPQWLPTIPVVFKLNPALRAYPDTVTISGDVEMQRFFVHFFKSGEFSWTRGFTEEFKTPRFGSVRFQIHYYAAEGHFVLRTADGAVEHVGLEQRLSLPGVGSVIITADPEPPRAPEFEVSLADGQTLAVRVGDGSDPYWLRVRVTAYRDGDVLGRLLFEGGTGNSWSPMSADDGEEYPSDPFGYFDDYLDQPEGDQLKVAVSGQTTLGFVVNAPPLVLRDYQYAPVQFAEFAEPGAIRFAVAEPRHRRLQELPIVTPPVDYSSLYTVQRQGLGPLVQLLDAYQQTPLAVVTETPEVNALGFVALLLYSGETPPTVPIGATGTNLVAPVEGVESLARANTEGKHPVLVSLTPTPNGRLSVKGMAMGFPTVLLTTNGPRDATGSEETLKVGEHLLLGRRFLFTLARKDKSLALNFRGVGVRPKESPLIVGDPAPLSGIIDELKRKFPVVSIFEGAYFFRLMPKAERHIQYLVRDGDADLIIKEGVLHGESPRLACAQLSEQSVLHFRSEIETTLGFVGPLNNKGNLSLLLNGRHQFVKRVFFRPRTRELGCVSGTSTVHWRDDDDIPVEVGDEWVAFGEGASYFNESLQPLERPEPRSSYLALLGNQFLRVAWDPQPAFPLMPFRISYWGRLLDEPEIIFDGASHSFLKSQPAIKVRRIIHQMDLKNFAPRPLFYRSMASSDNAPPLFTEIATVDENDALRPMQGADTRVETTFEISAARAPKTTVDAPAITDNVTFTRSGTDPWSAGPTEWRSGESHSAEFEVDSAALAAAVQKDEPRFEKSSPGMPVPLIAREPVEFAESPQHRPGNAVETLTPLSHGAAVVSSGGAVELCVIDRSVNALGPFPSVEAFPMVLLLKASATAFHIDVESDLLTIDGQSQQTLVFGKAHLGNRPDLPILSGSHISRAHGELMARNGRVFVCVMKERLVAPSVLNFERILTPDQWVRLEDGDLLTVGYHLYSVSFAPGRLDFQLAGYLLPRSIKGEPVRRVEIVAGQPEQDRTGTLSLSVGDLLEPVSITLGYEEIQQRLPAEAAALFSIEPFLQHAEMLRVHKQRADLTLKVNEDGFLYRPHTDFHALDAHTLMDDIVMAEFFLTNYHREDSVRIFPPRLHKADDRKQDFVELRRTESGFAALPKHERAYVIKDGVRVTGREVELSHGDIIDCHGAILRVTLARDELSLSLQGFVLDEHATSVGNQFDLCDIFMEVPKFVIPARRGLCAIGDQTRVRPALAPKEWISDDVTKDRVNLRFGTGQNDFEYELAGESRTLMDPLTTSEMLITRGPLDHKAHFPLGLRPEDGFAFARVKRGSRGFMIEALGAGLHRLGPEGLRTIEKGESLSLRVDDVIVLSQGVALKLVRSVLPDFLLTLKGCSLAVPSELISPVAGRIKPRVTIWRVAPSQAAEIQHPLAGRIMLDQSGLTHEGRRVEFAENEYKIVVDG